MRYLTFFCKECVTLKWILWRWFKRRINALQEVLSYECSSCDNQALWHDDVIEWKKIPVIGHLCGEFTGHRWIPLTKASDAELWSFFKLRLNKRLSKQWWGWWFETPSRPLWRHCNEDLTHVQHIGRYNLFRRVKVSKTFCLR